MELWVGWDKTIENWVLYSNWLCDLCWYLMNSGLHIIDWIECHEILLNWMSTLWFVLEFNIQFCWLVNMYGLIIQFIWGCIHRSRDFWIHCEVSGAWKDFILMLAEVKADLLDCIVTEINTHRNSLEYI